MQKAAKSLIASVFAQKNVSINMFESSLDVGAKNLDEIIGLCNPFCKALKFSESRICVRLWATQQDPKKAQIKLSQFWMNTQGD